jgi:flagellar protein FlaG
MNDIKANMTDRVQLVSGSTQKSAKSSSTAVNAYEQSTAQESGKKLPAGVEKVAEASQDQVKEAVSKLNDYVQSTERTLDFQMDEDSGQTIIKVFDKQSSELIRQIPNELALELAQKLNDDEPSLLFSAQV